MKTFLFLTASACLIVSILSSSSTLPKLPKLSYQKVYPNISQSLDTGALDEINLGLWSYCIRNITDWDPCDNVVPCVSSPGMCSSTSFGYRIHFKRANETVADAHEISTVTPAVVHTILIALLAFRAILHIFDSAYLPAILLSCFVALADLVCHVRFQAQVKRAIRGAINPNSSVDLDGSAIIMIALVAILSSESMFVTSIGCYEFAESQTAREADARERGWYRTVGYIKEVLLEPGQYLSLLVRRSHLKHQLFEGYECKLCWENKEKVYITPSEEVYCERCIGATKYRDRHAQQLCYTFGSHWVGKKPYATSKGEALQVKPLTVSG